MALDSVVLNQPRVDVILKVIWWKELKQNTDVVSNFSADAEHSKVDRWSVNIEPNLVIQLGEKLGDSLVAGYVVEDAGVEVADQCGRRATELLFGCILVVAE